jgi:hypothetical protein
MGNHVQQIVRHATSELLIIQNFKRYAAGKVNENLVVYGFEALPAMLYILTRGNHNDYLVESVRILPDFVEKIIDGYTREVIAFIYTHRLYADDENGETKEQIAMYYEDNLLRITHYHDTQYDVKSDAVAINNEPILSKFNEYHPAMINLSNLLSIN